MLGHHAARLREVTGLECGREADVLVYAALVGDLGVFLGPNDVHRKGPAEQGRYHLDGGVMRGAHEDGMELGGKSDVVLTSVERLYRSTAHILQRRDISVARASVCQVHDSQFDNEPDLGHLLGGDVAGHEHVADALADNLGRGGRYERSPRGSYTDLDETHG